MSENLAPSLPSPLLAQTLRIRAPLREPPEPRGVAERRPGPRSPSTPTSAHAAYASHKAQAPSPTLPFWGRRGPSSTAPLTQTPPDSDLCIGASSKAIRAVRSVSATRCLLAYNCQQSVLHLPNALIYGADAPKSIRWFIPPTRKQCHPNCFASMGLLASRHKAAKTRSKIVTVSRLPGRPPGPRIS